MVADLHCTYIVLIEKLRSRTDRYRAPSPAAMLIRWPIEVLRPTAGRTSHRRFDVIGINGQYE